MNSAFRAEGRVEAPNGRTMTIRRGEVGKTKLHGKGSLRGSMCEHPDASQVDTDTRIPGDQGGEEDSYSC